MSHQQPQFSPLNNRALFWVKTILLRHPSHVDAVFVVIVVVVVVVVVVLDAILVNTKCLKPFWEAFLSHAILAEAEAKALI